MTNTTRQLIEPSDMDLGDTPNSVRDYLHELEERNAELERERDELSAHVERCNVDTDKAIELLSLIRDGGFNLNELEDPVHDFLINYRFAESPKASLAEHDAEVARKAWDEALDAYARLRGLPILDDELAIAKSQYANKIRNVKDGE